MRYAAWTQRGALRAKVVGTRVVFKRNVGANVKQCKLYRCRPGRFGQFEGLEYNENSWTDTHDCKFVIVEDLK